SIALGLFVFPLLPEQTPIHWNAQGEIDGYGPPWIGALLFPAIMVFMLLLLIVVPKIAVFKENLKAFEKQYWQLGVVLELFFLIFFIVSLLPSFGITANFFVSFTIPFGFLFLAIGYLMPSFKRNFFVGIKTPWSLANDTVWEKTHSLGGTLFMLAGIIAIVSSLAPAQAFWIAIAAIIVATVIPLVYSFLLYQKIRERQL
ncbi:SdpI family protein, partial [Candidatus Micrarchaeota archaeon]|nr:SdpI family protein [Candidatus Micrarchaeota archaeon]